MDPNFKEWPASWFADSLSVVQEAEPNASITTAPCRYNPDDQCVQAIDFCPGDTECVGFWVISPILSFGHGNASYSESPGVSIGGMYLTTLWEVEVFYPQGLFVTAGEREVFLCETGSGNNYVLESESLIPVNQLALDTLADNGNGVFVGTVRNPRSVMDCGSS